MFLYIYVYLNNFMSSSSWPIFPLNMENMVFKNQVNLHIMNSEDNKSPKQIHKRGKNLSHNGMS